METEERLSRIRNIINKRKSHPLTKLARGLREVADLLDLLVKDYLVKWE